MGGEAKLCQAHGKDSHAQRRRPVRGSPAIACLPVQHLSHSVGLLLLLLFHHSPVGWGVGWCGVPAHSRQGSVLDSSPGHPSHVSLQTGHSRDPAPLSQGRVLCYCPPQSPTPPGGQKCPAPFLTPGRYELRTSLNRSRHPMQPVFFKQK